MSKKVLIHSLVFSPDSVSTAYLYNDIALKFKTEGYQVSVLTTTPHYNIVTSEVVKQPLTKKAFGLFYESNYNGIKVKHVYLKKYKSTALRMLGFIYWHIISFFIGLFERKIDIIISPSPPLTIGFLNILMGKIKGAKVIYNVQEIYPDLLIEEGGLKSKVIISFLKWLEKFVYNNSDAVTTIDEVFYNTIIGRFKDPSKLHIIPNFVDTAVYRPISPENIHIHLDESLFPRTKSLKLMYAGNIGFAQDWDILVALADELKNAPVEFFVIGEGAEKGRLLSARKDKQLENLHIVPYQPRVLMPSLLAYADLQFIFMTPKTEGHGFPSKVYTIMACSKPLLVCSSDNTPIINFLKDKNCAFLFTDKKIDDKVQKMAKLLRGIKYSNLEEMGKNGYSHIAENYSKDSVTMKYVSLADELL